MGADLLEPSVTDFVTDDGDHDRFSHYIRKDEYAGSMIEGIPVQALCGKWFVPCRDPERFPVCPDCKAIYEGLA